MGREHRNRYKELAGREIVLQGYDVADFRQANISGIVTHQQMTNGDSLSQFSAVTNGFVDYYIANVYPAVSSGQLDISVSVGGSVIASGAITSGRSAAQLYSHKKNDLTALSSGTVIEAAYAVPTALNEDATQGYALSLRVGLRHRDS